MTDEQKEWHLRFAKELFNGVWDLLDKSERTKDEDLQMIRMAHASRYHWGEVGAPLQFARGDWQIARVYAVLGFGVMSYKYGKSCLELCEQHDLGSFDLAFAYEALARASAVSGELDKGRGFIALGQATAVEIEDDQDREYAINELAKVEECL